MNNWKLFAFCCLLISACQSNTTEDSQLIHQVIDNWHESAANADYEEYFDAMTKDAVFIGTDAGENWTKKEFQSFSKPYFDDGKAWSFKALERNIYFSESGDLAWFDELLDTWMGTCRGSGVLVRSENTWKINHYVLSVCIPNDDMDKVITVKSVNDSIFRQDSNFQ